MFIKEKLYVQSFGPSLAIGIESDDQESVIRRHYSFFNHRATNQAIIWIEKSRAPYLGYFWTKRFKLIKSLQSAALFWILNNEPLKYKGKKNGALPEALIMAETVLNAIEPKIFIINHEYRNINSETLDDLIGPTNTELDKIP